MPQKYKPTGNPNGRPPIYKTAAEMQKKIDAFFVECDEKEKPYTIYGLALALGMDRKTILNYAGREEFVHVIKGARDRIRNSVEERIMNGQQGAGLIFWLKNNAEWADKKEVEHSGNVNVSVNIQGWSDDENSAEE